MFCFLGKTCKVAILIEVLPLGMNVVELMRKCVALCRLCLCACVHTYEGEREKQRETERERDGWTDGQTDGQMRDRERQREKGMGGRTDRHIDR